ncbi:MAG TPA: cytochrome c [Vicinamibacterales bacterium]|nr:cytochrome c [Vicinamibacterales bacterium]
MARRLSLFAALLGTCGVTLTGVFAAQAPAAPEPRGDAPAEKMIWAGVYSQAQLERGKAPFVGVCRRCHGDDLGGTRRGPALRGESFMADWEGQDLERLFDKIRDTMPPDSPSSLDDEDYLGAMVNILQANAYPAGDKDLTIDEMADVQILRKPVPGEGPRQARSFSIVDVVGCLTRGPGDTWMLTETTEPVLTRGRPATEEELKNAGTRPLGRSTFQLVSVAPFKPEAHQGQRMDAKGLLYRAPNKDRLNLSSLQMVAATCAGS